MTILANRNQSRNSFQGSALECTVFEALPREWASFCTGGGPKTAGGACKTLGNQAEPGYQLVVISEKCR